MPSLRVPSMRVRLLGEVSSKHTSAMTWGQPQGSEMVRTQELLEYLRRSIAEKGERITMHAPDPFGPSRSDQHRRYLL